MLVKVHVQAFCVFLQGLYAVASVICPGGYILESNTCYKYHSNCVTWQSARSSCQNEGGYLFATKDQYTFKIAQKVSRRNGGSLCEHGIWLGGHRVGDTLRLVWEDDNSLINHKQFFIGGHPDNKNQNENCVEIRHVDEFGGRLNDNDCSIGKGFICQSQYCDDIVHCKTVKCTTHTEPRCSECDNNRILYKVTHGGLQCEKMCSWNGDFCWPGTCADDLSKNCKCATGFKKDNPGGKTLCQPVVTPDIDTCEMTAIGKGGEKARASESGNSSDCQYKVDVYGNFQPVNFTYDMTASFTVPKPFPNPRPNFISVEQFGVTDIDLAVRYHSISAGDVRQQVHHLFQGASNSDDAESPSYQKGTVNTAHTLADGDRLCLQYQASGGGFLKYKKTTGSHTPSAPIPYTKTHSKREVCYRYDNTAPRHCLDENTCAKEPLLLPTRITRSDDVTVTFEGWFDPIPVGGNKTSASGIATYQITMNEVNAVKGHPSVIDTKHVFTNIINTDISAETSMALNFTSNKPKLYCVTLEVKDVANNLRQARRFLLYDNSSAIETTSKLMRYISASQKTSYRWQTHHSAICLSWKGHFTNQFYNDNPLLNSISADALNLITGVYEQTTGTLSVSGTANVNGIVEFKKSWTLNNGTFSTEVTVPDFQNQSLCQNLPLSDGETYTFKIRAIDIVNNTYSETATVYIDASAPHVSNVWLVRHGYEGLYVHGDKDNDLSKIQLSFEALDPHSGIETIKWAFGSSDASNDLIEGFVSVQDTQKVSCPNDTKRCYCPDVGHCEIFKYNIFLNASSLVSDNKNTGVHNRNYYFTVKATNKAKLFNVEHIDVIMDESPPESGVVLEGPVDSADIDYTSDSSFLVHWHGFIDHESEIKFYRVGLSERCLATDELQQKFNESTNDVIIKEVPSGENSIKLPANFTGKRYVTVVAFNNAVDPSDPVCSDGITKDDSPPELRNVTLQNGKWSETVVCHDGLPWLMHASLTKIKLFQTKSCRELCSNTTTINIMPKVMKTTSIARKDEDISEFMCSTLPLFSEDEIIYIPNDHIYITWDVEETDSQIQDFFVGFGNDATEEAAPGLVAYKSTNKKTFFKKNHEGIGTNSLFYVFIKALNKAGLEKTTTIGPVLIDETPPLARDVPQMTINGDRLIFGWENNTFYDTEQTEMINQVFMEFRYGSRGVSPLLEWRLDSSIPCLNFTGGCITYPLRKLQRQDTEEGLEFYAALYVYNIAGHFVRKQTDAFRLPSRYSPGHGKVLDIDPDSLSQHDKERLTDTDVHFTAHTICVTWSGFHHHGDVKFDISVGESPGTDDVISFQKTNSTDFFCVTSSDVKINTRYFVSVRASCSGGQTLANSNGVTVLDEHQLLKSLTVTNGKNCVSKVPIVNATFVEHDRLNSSVIFAHKLTVGRNYLFKLSGRFKRHINVSSLDSLVIDKGHNIYTLIPFIEYPSLSIDGAFNQSIAVHIVDCPDISYVARLDLLSAHWTINYTTNTRLTFQSALMVTPRSSSTNSTSTVTEFKDTESTNSTTIRDIALTTGSVYNVLVRPCTKTHCTDFVKSNDIHVDLIGPTGSVTYSELDIGSGVDVKCHTLKMGWNEFSSDSHIMFYQWSIASDSNAHTGLTNWKTIVADGKAMYKVDECISIPGGTHQTLFGCVRAFPRAANLGMMCKQLNIEPTSGAGQGVVHDFDMSAATWPLIMDLIHSSNIGEKISILHDADVDFGTTFTRIAGAMLYASEREVTWYMMTSQNVPKSCHVDPPCIETISTKTGFAEFQRNKIVPDVYHYICAYSNKTDDVREMFVEIFSEISACSNGFVLDDIKPTAGHVDVLATHGYVTDTSDILVTWDKFHDNVDATMIGYLDSIKQYSLAIGTRPGGEDIKQYVVLGRTNTHVVRHVNISDGMAMFVSIKATDHAGLKIVASTEEIIVDRSPPTAGKVFISDDETMAQAFISSDTITVRINGFHDSHSGISYFNVGVGLHNDTADMIPFERYTDDVIEIYVANRVLHDGFPYFIIVQAVNRAGLSSQMVSQSFLFDKSPPTGGHVMDGSSESSNDVDFQHDISNIGGHWGGFTDHHSGIYYYEVGLGTRPYKTDVEPMVDVGLRTDVLWNSSFIPGQKYYITVKACNGASLSRTMSSDGIILDNSPPIAGLVRVGSEGKHQKYQPHTSSLHMRWVGFEDPQSGIDHFEACIGRRPGTCDVLSFFTCLLASNVIKTGITLPINVDLYATVKAFNRVGLAAVQTSDLFRVDDTPPNLEVKPTFLTDYSSSSGFSAQWDRSLLRIYWNFTDAESPIVRHIVTLMTHHEGHTPIEHIEIGPRNKVTIQLDGDNWLNIGDKYFVTVTCCNDAGLCTSADSDDLLIDSTPPHIGGFKPPMTWTNYYDVNGNKTSTLTLTWYGFFDQESGIGRFYVGVSRNYSGDELSNGTIAILPTHARANNEYVSDLNLIERLTQDDRIFLTILAENHAGLNSSMATITVNVLSTGIGNLSQTGILEIEKHSCDIQYCTGDCSCAVVGKPCKMDASFGAKVCNAVGTDDANGKDIPNVTVRGGLSDNPINITASSACLAGHWVTESSNITLPVLRYEWSTGILGQPSGEGVFDKSTSPWNDIGLRSEFVYCLPINRSLTHGVLYTIYVRAWYSNASYSVFSSTGVMVDQNSPHIRKGSMIKDSDRACSQEFDFIDWMDTITACWDAVFDEPQGHILYFIVSLGTSPGADDLFPHTNVGLSTNITLDSISLSHGTKYYFTVTAYNNVGLHSTLSSDGFVVDMDKPLAGIVFNTDRHTDAPFQASSVSFSISWHGFIDNFSGIKSYFVALGDGSSLNDTVVNFTNVGLRTWHTFTGLTLEQGHSYYGRVKAVDAAGHESDVAVSSGRVVDETAPEGFVCQKFALIENVTESSNGANRVTITMEHDLTKYTLYKIVGYISSSSPGNVYLNKDKLRMKLPVAINHDESSHIEYGFISQFDGVHNVSVELEDIETGITVTLELVKCLVTKKASSSAVHVRQIGKSVLSANVQLLDQESSLYKVLVGAGTTPGGFQVRPLIPVSGGTNGIIRTDAQHGSNIYVTIIAENYAGLRTKFHSDPVVLDHTGPDLMISQSDAVLDIVNSTNISEYSVVINTTWFTEDKESGIKSCFCAIGQNPGTSDVQIKRRADTHMSCISELGRVSFPHGTKLYVTVTCVNNIELATEAVSTPVVLITDAPTSTNAIVRFNKYEKEDVPINEHVSKSSSITVDGDKPVYLQSGLKCLEFEWSGFEDVTGIEFYEYRLVHRNATLLDWASNKLQTMESTCDIGGLISGQVYSVEIRAVNSAQLKSEVIRTDILIDNSVPMLSGMPIKVTRHGNSLHADWNDVFLDVPYFTPIYSVSIGSRPGFSDIVDVPFIDEHSQDVTVFGSSVDAAVHELHVTVTCAFPTGLFNTYRTSIKI